MGSRIPKMVGEKGENHKMLDDILQAKKQRWEPPKIEWELGLTL